MSNSFLSLIVEGKRIAKHSKMSIASGPVAQRITRLTTDQEIPGSNPGGLVNIFLLGVELITRRVIVASDRQLVLFRKCEN